jgi:hypothetical protein
MIQFLLQLVVVIIILLLLLLPLLLLLRFVQLLFSYQVIGFAADGYATYGLAHTQTNPHKAQERKQKNTNTYAHNICVSSE